MDSTIRTLLINGLSFISALLVFLAIFVPGIIGIWKIFKDRSIETSDLEIKLGFLFLFLTNISFSLLLAVKDPQNILGAVFSGIGITIVLLFFFGITLLQIRVIRGKGSIKKFFTKKMKSQSKTKK